MCTCTWAIRPIPSFFFFLISFSGCMLPASSSSSFLCLTAHDFFLLDFYFLINWVIFFGHFFVLIGHHFLIRVYDKIYTNSLFLSLHLSTTNQTKMREIKIFFILPLFHHFTIFYPFTFPLLQPNKPLMKAKN